MKEVYKLVLKEDGYFSLTTRGSRYRLRYAIGEKTEAPPETSGVCCFSSFQAARCFFRDWGWDTVSACRILRVQPHGRKQKPRLLTGFAEVEAEADLALKHPDWQGPEGTVCYGAITPLEEVAI